MSYILNALRKSEQERQAHRPTLQKSIYLERTVEKHRGVWLIVALIVINLATLLLFIRLSTTERNVEQPATPPVRHGTPVAKTTPANLPRLYAGVQKHPAVLPPESGKLPQPAKKKHDFSISGIVNARQNPSSIPANKAGATSRKGNPAGQPGTGKKPLQASSTAPANPLKPAPKAAGSDAEATHPEPVKNIAAMAPQQKKALPPGRQAPQPAATRKTGVFKESQDPAGRIRTREPSKASSAKTMRQKPPAAAKAKAPRPSVPLLSELPLEFRRQVPRLNINVFVYADEPQQRFVIVDMVKYRTGENIQQIQLKEILSDSLVVEYMGKTFRILRP